MAENFTQELAFGKWLSGILQDTITNIQRRAIVLNGTVTITLQDINLSGFGGSFAIGIPAGGNLLGWTLGSAITPTGLPSGLTIDTSAHTWSWSGTGTVATSSFTFSEVLAGATNTPHVSTVNYSIVTAPTLGALSFSATTFTAGSSSSGTIIGATTASTITASGLPTGLTINSAARTWAWDGTGTASTGSFTLTETLTGATNTPHNSTISYTIAAAGTLATPTVTNVSSAGTTPLVLALSDGDYVAGKYLQWEFAGSLTPTKNTDGSYTTTTQNGLAFIDGDSWARLDLALGYNDPAGVMAFHCRVLQDNPSGAVTVTDTFGNTFNVDVSAWSTDYTDTIIWTPAALFTSGEQGYVFDPTSTSNFFQDSAGTTAGAFTSPIGLLKDVSGKGHDFSQATAGKRPTAVSPGWVNFDGVDDILTLAQVMLFGTAAGASIIAAVNAANQGTTKVWWGEDSTSSDNPGYRPGTQTNGATAVLWESDDSNNTHLNSVDTLLTLFDGAGHIFSMVDTHSAGSNGSVNTWKDRSASSTNPSAYFYGNTTTLNVTSLGALKRTTEIVNFAGKIGRAIFINRPLTSTERANAEAWCASPYGITLP